MLVYFIIVKHDIITMINCFDHIETLDGNHGMVLPILFYTMLLYFK